MKPTKYAVLLATSSQADVTRGGGKITFTGLRPIIAKDIVQIQQIKYRAEVAQVVRIGGTSYTPAASTTYAVEVYDPNRTADGYQESPKVYSYPTPATLTDIGANASDQRDYIHAQLAAAINADPSNKASAAAVAAGAGLDITDDGGYYPVKSQTMTNVKGANFVAPKTVNGAGFAKTNVSVRTAAVTSFGDGTILASLKPVTDKVFGNLISGTLEAPPLTTAGAAATAGQKYDAFVFTYLQKSPVPQGADYTCYVEAEQAIYVDNGTGTATTNLTGFLAFENVCRRIIAQTFHNDQNSLYSFFGSPMLFQGPAGAVPATTGESKIADSNFQWVYNNIGTNTITVPTPQATGLRLDQDLTDTEGAEHTPHLLATNKQSFIVGKTAFSLVAKMFVADHTDAKMVIGFRKRASHAADFNDYTDLAAVGFIGDLVYTYGILNNAATVATNTTIVPVDSAYEDFVVEVAIDGTVTCKYKNVTYPVYSVGTTALVLDAGDEMIPTILAVNVGGGDPDADLNHFISVASNRWLA